MKILLILRHAKSSWENPLLEDIDRPLNPRGLKTAPLMGQWAVQKELIPQKILTSPAKRAIQTAQLFSKATKMNININSTESFYPGETKDFLKALSLEPETVSTLMIVGHNPSLEIFLQYLTEKNESLSTCSLAVIHFFHKNWQEISSHPKGKLIQVYRPKELFKEPTD